MATLISAAQLASILRVSEQTLINWQRAGIGPSGTRSIEGRLHYDLYKVTCWYARNVDPGAISGIPNDLMNATEAAKYLRVSRSKLDYWRIRDCGPKCYKLTRTKGCKVLYRRSELYAWAALQP